MDIQARARRYRWHLAVLELGREGATRGFASNPGPGSQAAANLCILSASVTTASSVPPLATAFLGPLVITTQEPRLSPGVAEEAHAGLRAQQLVGLWPSGEQPLVAAFTREVAARQYPVQAPATLLQRISRLTICRAVFDLFQCGRRPGCGPTL